MKKDISRFIGIIMCCIPVATLAQTSEKITSPVNLYKEGRQLFLQKSYAAAVPPLKAFMSQQPSDEMLRMDTEYMLACAAYELKDKNRIARLRSYLDEFPDTPYANRIYALMAAGYFYEAKYDEALALFNSSRLDLLGNEERDDMTYLLATSYLKVGDVKEAAIWFETLRASSGKYETDCTYYLSYIRYTQKRYDEALKGFLSLQDNSKYRALAPYYIAEIYAVKRNYDKAEIVAQDYLSAYPNNEHSAEMYRILGDSYYHMHRYQQAVTAFQSYLQQDSKPRRDALYMLGLAYFQTGVYSKAASTLGEVTAPNDALTQNAYLHMGLSYLQLAEKNKARMAFEQAAASDADRKIKEQAAYNYALCIHETSYSAFGESVTVFEKFLNEFPNSSYADMVSNYLIEVYMNTRSYEAALKSISRIAQPGKRILEAKQKILFQLGTQAFANTHFEQAIDYFNQSINLGQYNRQTKADALYWRGESYYRLNRMQEAGRNFTEYLQLTQQTDNEMYALAHYNLGYIAFHRKDYAEAQNWFQKYARLEKGENNAALADAYNRIGDSYLNTRRFEEAKHYYAQAEAMNTSSGDYSFYQLALVSGLQKDYAGKITLLNRLVGKYPNSPYAINAIYEKGRSYVLNDNNTQAITAFKELLSKYPESPVSRKAAAEIGLLYYQNEEYAKAIEAYKHVIQKYPGSEEARLSMRDMKSIYVDMNRIDEFAALANSLPGNIRFEASEQDSLTYMAAEKIYMRGRIEEAKASFNKYVQTFPDGAFGLNANYYLCLIGKEQKNYDMILLHSGRLLEYPDNPFLEEALILRAEVQFNQHQFAEALKSYQLLKEKATQTDRRLLAETGMLRSAALLKDDIEVIHAATALLAEAKLSPELANEALYYRAKAYLNQQAESKAMTDLKVLAKDTRNLYGAEAKFLVAQQLYNAKEYAAAEKELLNYIDQSTPHTYWLARSFVLLSDVYVAMGKNLDARQYLLSLQQNYTGNDDIANMIESRLKNLNK
ncbi:tetratricopeptide repeat protein [Bacteroides sp.]|uniref:tetratricopeptide repeat protein n=1 Tax=Bacteroides sp. TaxID=29523 RepID=UPI002FC7C0DD